MALVELSMVILMLLMVTFGAMEYGWMFSQMHQLNNAARAGARVAVLPDSNGGMVGTTVENVLGRSPDNLQLEPPDITFPSAGQLVRVTVTINYTPLIGIPFLPTPDDLTASVAMAKEGPA